MSDGASPAVKAALQLLISDEDDGVLIPIPQYPLYSAAISNLGGTAIGYHLDEESGWAVTMPAIEKAIAEFRSTKQNGRLKGICMINPGNPTGNVMSRDQMEAVVRLCVDRNLVLLADEVYQENVWIEEKNFLSFRRVALEMGLPAEIISFHSISKGYYGECGLRGGYMQLHNIDPEVGDQIYKMASISLCSNTLGQAMVSSVTNPPANGDASYQQFQHERGVILDSLRRKSALVASRLDKMPGISCQPVEGALYAFPRLHLPDAALRAATAAGKLPDTFYCMELLKATGIVVVPGSGFHQKEGTWHFRITILPKEDKLPAILDRLEAFHANFMTQYATSER